eukprot:5659445-Prymnesium_polylepis.2
MLRALLRRFPSMGKKAATLTVDECEFLSPASLMSNHFYTYEAGKEVLALSASIRRLRAHSCPRV